jgi:uncharacterized protein (TIGR02266 family)
MSKAGRKLVPRDDRVTINHEFASVEEFITEYVSNISRSGVFIRTRHPFAAGTKVNLKFTVIMEDLETIEGVGEVVRVSDDPPGMGVVFVTLTAHSQDLIHKLITRRRSPRAETMRGVGTDAPPPGPPGPAQVSTGTGKARASTSMSLPPPPPAEAYGRKRTSKKNDE